MDFSTKFIFCLCLFFGIFLTAFLSRFIFQGSASYPLIGVEDSHLLKNSTLPDVLTIVADGKVYSISTNALSLISFYNKFSKISNLSECASNLSSWNILGNKTNYNLGETIQLSITLYDGYKKRLTTGGDFLRIWGVNPFLKASIAGYTVDHRNGSYTGFVRAGWRGKMEIRLMLATTKEHVGVFLDKIDKYGITVPIIASFTRNTNGKAITENTRCSTIPNVIGSNEICNFTALNFNMSWYCGKPSEYNLRCEDWTHYSKRPPELFNTLELELMRHHKYLPFANPKPVTVSGKTERLPEQRQSCSSRRSKDTWYDTLPTGYLFKNKWYSLSCTSNLRRTKTAYLKCLANRTVHFYGDSTTRAWFSFLKTYLDMQMIHGNGNKESLQGVHKLTKAEKRQFNISLRWAPHEFPFYGSHSSRLNIRSVGFYIDTIPSNSNVVLVLHWYLHMSRAGQDIYRQHIQNAKHAVMRLLNRSPEAKIFIKGPHSFQFLYHVEPHDYVKQYQQQIVFEEFRQLQDKIVYLDQWDITIGNKHNDAHPEFLVDREMVHNLLSHICP